MPRAIQTVQRELVRMYTVSVESHFCATHRVRTSEGQWEATHGHDWMVRVWFARLELTDDGMVVDFERATAGLATITESLHHKDLNAYDGLSGQIPTAEIVARYIFDRLAALGFDSLFRVELTEAPGCIATFQQGQPMDL